MMKITPDNQSLFNLVEKAQRNKLVLPDFQRSFVWPYADVKDLLISIFKGYYIGSILLQDADSRSLPFAYRSIEGVENQPTDADVEKYILDGQQRITTLHYVLYAPQSVNLKYTSSPYAFFLKLSDFMDDDLESAIYGDRLKNCQKLIDNRMSQYEKKIVPFVSLTQDKWLEWSSGYVDAAKDDAQKAERAMEVMSWNNKLHPFFSFQTTTMTIDKVSQEDNEGVAEICAVFEKMNSKGVKLTVFDLLTARLYRSNISLRQLWQDAYQQNEYINRFSDPDPGVYAVFILRVVGLIRGLDIKSSSLINLSPENFENDFIVAVKAFDKALQRIQSIQGYGAFDTKWVPYPPMVATLAALIHLTDSMKLDAKATHVIDKWYWGSVFGERYSSAVESVIARDYRDLKNYLIGKKDSSEVLYEIDQDLTKQNLLNKLFSTNRARSSVYSGVICLMALNGARDFRTDNSITLHTLDDHHIFPKNYLAKHYKKSNTHITDNQINCILNKTLISDRTNRMISNKAPSLYLNDPQIIDPSNRSDILRKHFIDGSSLESMLVDDFSGFQNNRAESIIKSILSRVQ